MTESGSDSDDEEFSEHGVASYLPELVQRYVKKRLPLTNHWEQMQGATLFFDISGFTRLTESLSSKPEGEGAELISSHLNQYFSNVLAVADQFGGDTVSFAGDALLILWVKDDSSSEDLLEPSLQYPVQQALGCAIDLLEVGNALVGEGESAVQLEAHVGVGCGSFAAMYGGIQDHWKWLILGSAVRSAALACSLAGSGQLVLSNNAYSLVKNMCSCESIMSHKDNNILQGYKFTKMIAPNPACSRMALALNTVRTRRSSHRSRSFSPRSAMGHSPRFPPDHPSFNQPTLTPLMRSVSQPRVTTASTPFEPSTKPIIGALSIPTHMISFEREPSTNLIDSAREVIRRDSARSTQTVSMLMSNAHKLLFDIIWKSPSECSGQLRTVSTLFVKLLSSDTECNQNTELEMVQTSLQLLMERVRKYDGICNKVVHDDKGVLALCVFGLPFHSHEDDASRSVRFALSLAHRLERIVGKVCMGITRARVYCGIVGSRNRCEYSVMGEGVNLAARLMGVQFPTLSLESQIICDEPSYTSCEQQRISFGPRTMLSLKGIGAPVPTYRVLLTSHSAPGAGCRSSRSSLRSGSSDSPSSESSPRSNSRSHGRSEPDMSDVVPSQTSRIQPPPLEMVLPFSVLGGSARSIISPVKRTISTRGSPRLRRIASIPNSPRKNLIIEEEPPSPRSPRTGPGSSSTSSPLATRPSSPPRKPFLPKNLQAVETLIGRENEIKLIRSLVHHMGGRPQRSSPLLSPSPFGTSFSDTPIGILLLGESDSGKSLMLEAACQICDQAQVEWLLVVAQTVEGNSAHGLRPLVEELLWCLPDGGDDQQSPRKAAVGAFTPFLDTPDVYSRPKRRVATFIPLPSTPSPPSSPSPIPSGQTSSIFMATKKLMKLLKEADRLLLPFLSEVLPELSIDLQGLPFDSTRSSPMAIYDVIIAIMNCVYGINPLLLLVDDAHRLDTITLEFFLHLSKTLPHVRILMAGRPSMDENMSSGTMKLDSELANNMPQGLHLHTITLGPLSSADANTLYCRILDVDRIQPSLHTFVFERTDGVPGLAEPLLVTLFEIGALNIENASATMNPGGELKLDQTTLVTSSAEASVLARLDRLPTSEVHLLKVASVLGRKFKPQLLAAVLKVEPEEVAFTLQRLSQLGFLQSKRTTPAPSRIRSIRDVVSRLSQEYSFKLSSVHNVIYNTILLRERTQVHSTVARCLEKIGEADCALLAFHYTRSDDSTKALWALDKAAMASFRRHAYSECLGYTSEALKLSQNDNTAKDSSPIAPVQRIYLVACCNYQLGDQKYLESALKGLDMLRVTLPSSNWSCRVRTSGCWIRQWINRKRRESFRQTNTIIKWPDVYLDPLLIECDLMSMMASYYYHNGFKKKFIYAALKAANYADSINQNETARKYDVCSTRSKGYGWTLITSTISKTPAPPEVYLTYSDVYSNPSYKETMQSRSYYSNLYHLFSSEFDHVLPEKDGTQDFRYSLTHQNAHRSLWLTILREGFKGNLQQAIKIAEQGTKVAHKSFCHNLMMQTELLTVLVGGFWMGDPSYCSPIQRLAEWAKSSKCDPATNLLILALELYTAHILQSKALDLKVSRNEVSSLESILEVACSFTVPTMHSILSLWVLGELCSISSYSGCQRIVKMMRTFSSRIPLAIPLTYLWEGYMHSMRTGHTNRATRCWTQASFDAIRLGLPLIQAHAIAALSLYGNNDNKTLQTMERACTIYSECGALFRAQNLRKKYGRHCSLDI